MINLTTQKREIGLSSQTVIFASIQVHRLLPTCVIRGVSDPSMIHLRGYWMDGKNTGRMIT